MRKTKKLINSVLVFTRKLSADSLSAFSAQSAFFIILSFFPFTMLFVSLLRFFNFTPQQISNFSFSFLTPGISQFIKDLLNEISDKASGAVISITTITALWSSSRGFLAVIRGLNSVYGIEEKRGYIRLRITTMFYTFVMIVVLLIMLAIFVFGSSLGNIVSEVSPYIKNIIDLFLNLRWIIGFGILIIFFMFIYTVIPTRKSRFIEELPGAVVSALGWIVFSALFSIYINEFANYSYFYGSLTTIVLLMLWLYFCMYIVFIGAEINDILQKPEYYPVVKAKVKKWLGRFSKNKTIR